MIKDYSQITEMPGAKVTQEQVLRAYQRYYFAVQFCEGKDVLEVACGGGLGLGLLARVAKSVTAIDIEKKNLDRAEATYQGHSKIKVLPGDAEQLRFGDRSFDVVILYEAIYYLSNPEKFLAECRRVLRLEGILIIGSANREWTDFNLSVYTTRYFSALELKDWMGQGGFRTDIYKGFPVNGQSQGGLSRHLSLIKRIAVKLRLIPKSMKYKKYLKRIFVGQLVPLPNELPEGLETYIPPDPLDLKQPDRQFKVIYAVGHIQ